MHEQTAAPVVADLRAGRRQERFKIRNESAALDLVQGTVLAAMRTVLEGRAGDGHDTAVAALILKSLGVEPAEADVIAHGPLLLQRAEQAPRRPARC